MGRYESLRNIYKLLARHAFEPTVTVAAAYNIVPASVWPCRPIPRDTAAELLLLPVTNLDAEPDCSEQPCCLLQFIDVAGLNLGVRPDRVAAANGVTDASLPAV